MLTIPSDLDLETRLAAIARRLGKSTAECALAALTAWVEDHEEAHAAAQQLTGGDGVHRPPEDGFYD
ncbi:MAG: hypothetical protein ACM3Q1_13465 [Bacteroidales bacterium]|jgi:hypothetical protein